MAAEKKTRAAAAGIATLALLGIGTLTLFAKTLPSRLRAPFGGAAVSSAPSSTSRESEDLLQATKDTDRDGIPDLQELRVYKTSPFLEDTDSDGILDKAEIDAGEDPNCPKGADCKAAFSELASSRDAQKKQITETLYRSSIISKLASSGLPGLTDANAIRGFLRQGGLSEDLLRQFDDATLLQLFNEASRAAQPNPLTSPATGGVPTPAASGRLPSNPPPSAIRDLLISAGMDKATLEKIDDATLVRLYQDTLKDAKR